MTTSNQKRLQEMLEIAKKTTDVPDERAIVRTMARGNVNLKLGRYTTPEQHEARVQRILKYEF